MPSSFESSDGVYWLGEWEYPAVSNAKSDMTPLVNCGMWQLRDIEILVQAQLEVLEAAQTDDETLREIQKILYSTEVRPEDSIAFFHSFSPFVFVTSMVTVRYPPITSWHLFFRLN